MASTPMVLSPALPSELLTYILNHHVYPTTLIICSTRSEFLESLTENVWRQSTTPERHAGEPGSDAPPGQPDVQHPSDSHHPGHSLLSSPLYQLAISRHIRIVYIPTVTHLRAYLSIFPPQDSKVKEPPSTFHPAGRSPPHLIIYGVIELHRDTSEWSAQGLGNTAAALVETGHRLGWQLAVVEPKRRGNHDEFENLLRETLPMLSGGGRRMGVDSEEGGWSGRTVEVGRVMRRWFRFQRGAWDQNTDRNQTEARVAEMPNPVAN